MRRPTKYLLILFTFLFSLLTPSFAQKRQIDDAQALLRKGRDFAKVEKMMTDLLKKDSANLSNLRIYDVWLESVEKQYGELNEKMYKRQPIVSSPSPSVSTPSICVPTSGDVSTPNTARAMRSG